MRWGAYQGNYTSLYVLKTGIIVAYESFLADIYTSQVDEKLYVCPGLSIFRDFSCEHSLK